MVFGRGQVQTEGDAATLHLGPGINNMVLKIKHLFTYSCLGEEFDKEHCLTNAEVLLLLDDIAAKRQIDSQTIPLPPPSQY